MTDPGEFTGKPIMATLAVVTALVLLLLAAVGIPVRADSSGVSSPDPAVRTAEVLARLSGAYASMKSFEARFKQTSTGLSFPVPVIQEGVLQVQKPNQLRWEFQKPTRKLFLSDGRELWVVDERDKTCTHYSGVMGSLERFLAVFNGADGLSKHHRIELVESSEASLDTLRLLPREQDSAVAEVLLVLERKSGLIRKVVTVSALGDRTETELSSLVLGGEIAAEQFRYQQRPGFQLIEAG
ncbi:MAG: hypothetical protein CMP23_13700 [Rickettsiales bacterium]|nr:hypothetical protein [Rickettsiales bacterium]|tara:strand:- start:849 stop:1568 length:720 start_codon:yes stop_codon:yes gene_type:complete